MYEKARQNENVWLDEIFRFVKYFLLLFNYDNVAVDAKKLVLVRSNVFTSYPPHISQTGLAQVSSKAGGVPLF